MPTSITFLWLADLPKIADVIPVNPLDCVCVGGGLHCTKPILSLSCQWLVNRQ